MPDVRLRRSARFPLDPAGLWDLMFRQDVVSEWAGRGTQLQLSVGSRLVLSDGLQANRFGSVTAVDVDHLHVTADIPLPPAADGAPRTSVLTISIVGRVKSGPGSTGRTFTRTTSELRIRQGALQRGIEFDDLDRFWGDCLARLRDLVRTIERRRTHPRQAVIVIHGIGEQLPGATLAALVNSGIVPPQGAAPDRWVKPDHMSDSFELRKVSVKGTPDLLMPSTDLYEFYWAHLIRDTTMGQLLGWTKAVLLRKPSHLPKPLRKYWWILFLLLAATSAFLVLGWLKLLPPGVAFGSALLGVVTVVGGWIVKLVSPIAVNTLGDAARYLRPEPGNIAHRQEIRQAGVDLLDRLHASGRYDRIILLGHSLGSVIAYDILTFAWIEMNKRHAEPDHTEFGAMRAAERLAADPPARRPGETAADRAARAARMQHKAWLEYRRNTGVWLVSDLVTVGAPLTYADLLMADSAEAFDRAKQDRILPTSPPRTETFRQSVSSAVVDIEHGRFSYESAYHEGTTGAPRTFTVPHHAALFSLTRWTNLYFKIDWFGGDPVGGPVAPMFGEWIRDIQMPSPKNGPFGFAHTKYWAPVGDGSHIHRLAEALALNNGLELRELNRKLPPYLFLPRASS